MLIMSPSRVTSSRSSVRNGDFAWHEAARNEVKSCRPSNGRAARRIAAACQAKSPIRTLDRLDVSRDGDLVTIEVAARSFLHHQVRNLVGTLKLVGDGSWPEERVATALAARDRAAAGPTAPAEGLTLVAVRYAGDPFNPLPR